VPIAQALYMVCTCLSKGIETIGNGIELGTNDDMNTITNERFSILIRTLMIKMITYFTYECL